MCKNYISLYHRLLGIYEAILFRQQVTMPCNIPFKATQQIWLWEKANDLNRLEKKSSFPNHHLCICSSRFNTILLMLDKHFSLFFLFTVRIILHNTTIKS